jgi:predicted PurR-regulated permease PerM
MVVVAVFAIAYLLWSGIHVLLLTFAGALVAIFLSACSDWVSSKTGWRRGLSLAATIAVVTLFAVGFTWLLGARLADQAAELVQQLPKSRQQIEHYLDAHPWGRAILERLPKAAESLAQNGQLSRVTGLASGAAGFVLAIVVVAFVGIFGAAEPGIYKSGLIHLFPISRRKRAADAIDAVIFNLRSWLVGQGILMVLVGLTTTIALLLLGIPLALTLGVLTGLLEVIPYIGAWLSAVPAALIAFQLGPTYALITLAVYLGVHIFEGYVLSPLIQRRALHLPPAFTLVTQVLLGETLGALGLLIAAPLTVTVVTLVKIFYVRETLGDKTMQVPGLATRRDRNARRSAQN